jgi:hypothetical protein
MATQAECVKVIQTETERLRQYLAAFSGCLEQAERVRPLGNP